MFFKNFLATVVGVIVSFAIIFFIGFLVIMILVTSTASSSTYIVKNQSVLELKLEGKLSERKQVNPLMEYLGQSDKIMGLDDILSSIKKAKNNSNIKGIYINSGVFTAGAASLREIRNELQKFKQSGKFIVSYADFYTQGGYYLSSVADKIFLNPQGRLDLHGLSATPMFYKGLFDKLGIQMQIFRVGTYKSAVEPFILNKMSPANKEQISSYMNSSWQTILGDISHSRHISVKALNQLADSLPMLGDDKQLYAKKIVDSLLYRTDVDDYLKGKIYGDEHSKKNLNIVSVDQMSKVQYKHEIYKDKVAVLYAEGTIYDAGDKGITSDKMVREITKLKNDDHVKAVVFRVNSPGGSAYASEQIWKAVTDLKAVKPVVVSMGDVAASGGYYISSNATKIYAQPNTITGSIGIFGMFPNVQGLVSKIGLSFDHIKTNLHADFGDITRPMRDDEKKILQGYINRGYDLFLSRCSEGRKMKKSAINKIAQGRVWTGTQALNIGLVDELGTIDDAIICAGKLAGLSHYNVVAYPHKKDFWSDLITNSKTSFESHLFYEYTGIKNSNLETLKEIKQQDYIQARLPYDISIN